MAEYRRILLDGYPCEVRREGDTLVAGDGREVGVTPLELPVDFAATSPVIVTILHTSRDDYCTGFLPSGVEPKFPEKNIKSRKTWVLT